MNIHRKITKNDLTFLFVLSILIFLSLVAFSLIGKQDAPLVGIPWIDHETDESLAGIPWIDSETDDTFAGIPWLDSEANDILASNPWIDGETA